MNKQEVFRKVFGTAALYFGAACLLAGAWVEQLMILEDGSLGAGSGFACMAIPFAIVLFVVRRYLTQEKYRQAWGMTLDKWVIGGVLGLSSLIFVRAEVWFFKLLGVLFLIAALFPLQFLNPLFEWQEELLEEKE